ncbi:MAG: hypothetical protein EP326_04675 [Deltaproteobacteria bacterium]|nr:MAG: hypothetical protein EP326_04675 [Deltaproteobacteria bacterium]
MKRSILTVLIALMLSVGSAHAYFGLGSSLWDLGSSFYNSITSDSVDAAEDTKNDVEESTLDDSDSLLSDSWFDDLWDDIWGTNDVDLSTNTCGKEKSSCLIFCGLGWDSLFGFMDNDWFKNISCNKADYTTGSSSAAVVDQKNYCQCLGNDASFPREGAKDVVQNLVEQKKKEMMADAFAKYQGVAKKLAEFALDPEAQKYLSDKDTCLPGNFQKIEKALFESPGANGQPSCNGNSKKLMETALNDEIEAYAKAAASCTGTDEQKAACLDKIPNKHVKDRETLEKFRTERVPSLDAEKNKDKDLSTMGAWLDFQLKNEFVEDSIRNLGLKRDKIPDPQKIIDQDFSKLSYDFFGVVRNAQLNVAAEESRTPAQIVSSGIAEYIANGMSCGEGGCRHLATAIRLTNPELDQSAGPRPGDGHEHSHVSIAEIASRYNRPVDNTEERRPAEFRGQGQGGFSKRLIDRFLVKNFRETMGSARDILESVERNISELEKDASNPQNAAMLANLKGIRSGLQGVVSQVKAAGVTDANGDKSLPDDKVLEVIKSSFAGGTPQEIEAGLLGFNRIAASVKVKKADMECRRLIESFTNMCAMFNEDNFSAGHFLGTVKSADPPPKSEVDFSKIKSLASDAVPEYDKDGKKLSKEEKDKIVADMEKTIDQLACYESNQLGGMIVEGENAILHPPYFDGKGNWLSCMKTCSRKYSFNGQESEMKYCALSNEKCPNEMAPLDPDASPTDDIYHADPIVNQVFRNLKGAGLRPPEVKDETQLADDSVRDAVDPNAGKDPNSGGNTGLYSNINDDTYQRTYSKPVDKSKSDYFDAISRGGDLALSGEPPMTYKDYQKKMQIGPDPAERDDSSVSKVYSDQMKPTEVNQDGTVSTPQIVDRTSGQPIQSSQLSTIDSQINRNNKALVEAGSQIGDIETKIKEANDSGNSSANAELNDQLAALRAQIESLKNDNKKLASERDEEIAKIAKAREERKAAQIAAAQRDNGGNTGGDGSSSVIPSFSTKSAIVSSDNGGTTGTGSSGIVSGSAGSVGSNNVAGPGTNTGLGTVSPIGGSNVVGGNGTISLTDASGAKYSISASEFIDFASMPEVKSFDSAVKIALESSKSAFVFDGKTYVKKGDGFIQVSADNPERAIASVEEPKTVDEVEKLTDAIADKYEVGEVKVEEKLDKPKETPVVVPQDKVEPASNDGERYNTRSLWDYIKKGANAFYDSMLSLPSK